VYSRIVPIAFVPLIACYPFGDAVAQNCTVSGSSVTLASGSCAVAPNTTLNGSPGVHTTTSAEVTTNNVTINPFNGGSIGGLAETNGIITFSSGSTIEGNYATAASTQTGGQIIFQPGSVIKPGSAGGETALLANGVGAGGQPSQITATGLTVNMNGFGGDRGAIASGGGSIFLNQGTTISFPPGGGGDIGLLATGANSQIVANGISDRMVGVGSGDVGVNADMGGKVTLTNSVMSDLGNGGGEVGLKATNSSSIVTSGGSVSVVNGVGGLLQNGSIAMDGTNVTASGNGGNGFQFNSGAGTNTLQYSNGTIAASGASFLVQGGAIANIDLTAATATVNNGTLLQTSGTTTFNAQGSTLQGVILTQGGTSMVNLAGGTTWTMTGNSNTTVLTNNNSTITFTPPTGDPTQLASYKTLTTVNFAGTGGEINLNTYLGADGSPSDRLIISGGMATGATSLMIHNTIGPGAETTGNGILVVDAINGTTAAGAFTLDNPELRAGAFDYRLFRGGLNGSDPNDWFLRSSFIVPPVPPGPVDPIGPDPPPATLPPGVWPIIGPELATDGVVQPIARQMGLQTLGTLHQRIGDTLTLANTGGEGSGLARSDWARFFGQGINNIYQAFADPRASGWMGGFQGGVDLLRSSFLPGHRDVAGVYLAFANSGKSLLTLQIGIMCGALASAIAVAMLPAWSPTLPQLGMCRTVPAQWVSTAIPLAATGPIMSERLVSRAVLQGTYYNGNAVTQFANLPLNGSGLISSLEGGYPILLPLGPRFVLEPQAQIIWQQVSFNQANDGLGPVGLGTTSGPTGRVGLRGMWTIDGYNGQVWQPYARANLWRDWGAQATTLFGIDAVPLIEEAMRLEFAGGMTALLGRGVGLYAQAGYQFGLDGAFLRNGIQGDIGLRYVW
jgi:type V secretory pathway adhesin AidA